MTALEIFIVLSPVLCVLTIIFLIASIMTIRWENKGYPQILKKLGL